VTERRASRATIVDVAKLAGVSPSTVSRVITGKPRISARTSRRVIEVMEELGYYPNMNARNLVAKQSNAIGLVIRSVENTFLNPFFPEVIRGISVAAQQEGFSIFMGMGRDAEEEKACAVKMVQGRQVDGVVLLHSRANDPLLPYLKQMQFPFVVVGRPKEKQTTYVDNDNVEGAAEATDYLIRKGHTSIAFLGGSMEYIVTVDRLDGYRKALAAAGLPFREEFVLEADFAEAGGSDAVRRLLSSGERPTALLVMDDVMAVGVLGALRELGLRVPEDVSVVSFNNVPLSRFCSPPLTTVDIGIYELGFLAASQLIERIRHPERPSTQTLVHTRIVERHSVRAWK